MAAVTTDTKGAAEPHAPVSSESVCIHCSRVDRDIYVILFMLSQFFDLFSKLWFPHGSSNQRYPLIARCPCGTSTDVTTCGRWRVRPPLLPAEITKWCNSLLWLLQCTSLCSHWRGIWVPSQDTTTAF